MTQTSPYGTEGHLFPYPKEKPAQHWDTDKPNHTTEGEMQTPFSTGLVRAWAPCKPWACTVPQGRASRLVFSSFCNLEVCCCAEYNKGSISFVGTQLSASPWLLSAAACMANLAQHHEHQLLKMPGLKWVIFQQPGLCAGSFPGCVFAVRFCCSSRLSC